MGGHRLNAKSINVGLKVARTVAVGTRVVAGALAIAAWSDAIFKLDKN